MQKIYLIYTIYNDELFVFKAFMNEYLAKNFQETIDDIIDKSNNIQNIVIEKLKYPKCPKMPVKRYDIDYMNYKDSEVGGKILVEKREKYKKQLEEYNIEYEKYRNECTNISNEQDKLIKQLRDELFTEEQKKYFNDYNDQLHTYVDMEEINVMENGEEK